VDGAIECIGGVEYVEGNWMNYGEFCGVWWNEHRYRCDQDFECGWSWKECQFDGEFKRDCVFGCHGEEERVFAVGLVDDMNRGAGDFADMVSSWVNPLLVVGGILTKVGDLASFRRLYNDSPDGLQLRDTTPEPSTASYTS